MTYRAIRVLSNVDVILCEDTRTTKNLLNHYKIITRTMSYHANSDDGKENTIIKMIKEGKTLALVSDAGTPCISDPGVRLVKRLYEEFPHISVQAIPGANALISALSISGISVAEFTFLGFVPHKKGRASFFGKVAQSEIPVVFYESPHRIMKMLSSLTNVLEKNTHHSIIVARELTKIYEEVVRGSAIEVLSYFENHPDHVRGEFVVIVSPK